MDRVERENPDAMDNSFVEKVSRLTDEELTEQIAMRVEVRRALLTLANQGDKDEEEWNTSERIEYAQKMVDKYIKKVK